MKYKPFTSLQRARAFVRVVEKSKSYKIEDISRNQDVVLVRTTYKNMDVLVAVRFYELHASLTIQVFRKYKDFNFFVFEKDIYYHQSGTVTLKLTDIDKVISYKL